MIPPATMNLVHTKLTQPERGNGVQYDYVSM